MDDVHDTEKVQAGVFSHLTPYLFCFLIKQKALQEAQEDLAVTQNILEDAKKKLVSVEENVAALQAKYHDCLSKRDELDSKCTLCEQRLVRADKVRL